MQQSNHAFLAVSAPSSRRAPLRRTATAALLPANTEEPGHGAGKRTIRMRPRQARVGPAPARAEAGQQAGREINPRQSRTEPPPDSRARGDGGLSYRGMTCARDPLQPYAVFGHMETTWTGIPKAAAGRTTYWPCCAARLPCPEGVTTHGNWRSLLIFL